MRMWTKQGRVDSCTQLMMRVAMADAANYCRGIELLLLSLSLHFSCFAFFFSLIVHWYSSSRGLQPPQPPLDPLETWQGLASKKKHGKDM